LMLQEVISNPDFKYNSKSLSDLLGINKSKLDLNFYINLCKKNLY